jgi:hypothetical protein
MRTASENLYGGKDVCGSLVASMAPILPFLKSTYCTRFAASPIKKPVSSTSESQLFSGFVWVNIMTHTRWYTYSKSRLKKPTIPVSLLKDERPWEMWSIHPNQYLPKSHSPQTTCQLTTNPWASSPVITWPCQDQQDHPLVAGPRESIYYFRPLSLVEFCYIVISNWNRPWDISKI